MPLISHRECHLYGVKDETLNKFVNELRSCLEQEKISKDYVVNVYKDTVTCCGHFAIGVAVEITGPKRQTIRNLDLKIYSKIIEICERENFEHHELQPLEVLKVG